MSDTATDNKKVVQILVVSHDMMEIHVLKKFLKVQEAEFIACHARDGIEALDFLERKGEHTNAPKVDLIIINPNLPKLNGYQVLEKINRDPELKGIPRIMIDKKQAPFSENLSPVLSPFFYVVEAYTKKQKLDQMALQ